MERPHEEAIRIDSIDYVVLMHTYVTNIQHNHHHFYFLGEDDSPEVLMEQIEIENGAGSVNLECVFEYDEEYCQARLNQERM